MLIPMYDQKIGTITFTGGTALYGKGLGVPVDREISASLYKQAADRGNLMAISNYGIRLLNGDGVEQNIEAGMHYVVQAAQAGEPDAMQALRYLEEAHGITHPDAPKLN